MTVNARSSQAPLGNCRKSFTSSRKHRLSKTKEALVTNKKKIKIKSTSLISLCSPFVIPDDTRLVSYQLERERYPNIDDFSLIYGPLELNDRLLSSFYSSVTSNDNNGNRQFHLNCLLNSISLINNDVPLDYYTDSDDLLHLEDGLVTDGESSDDDDVYNYDDDDDNDNDNDNDNGGSEKVKSEKLHINANANINSNINLNANLLKHTNATILVDDIMEKTISDITNSDNHDTIQIGIANY